VQHGDPAVWASAVAALLVVASLATPLSRRLGVPALLLFLVLGMLAGSEGVGGIPLDDYELVYQLGSAALVLILFNGGLHTPPAMLRRATGPAVLLSTLTVVGTAAIVAVAGWLLGLPAPIAILTGAVVSPTDAAAVFSVLGSSGVRLQERTRATLEVESGLNDPMAVLLTVVATDAVLRGVGPDAETVWLLAAQGGVGVLGGLACGWVGRWILRRGELPAAGLYPVLTTALAFGAFGLTALLHGSGYLGVYLAGVVIGDGRLPHRSTVRGFHEGLAWLAQVVMFLLLGLLASPSRIWPLADEGLVLALVLAFVARPLAVLLALVPFPYTRAERVFVAWVGLRGAVPIVLATYPAILGVPGGDHVFDLVFFVVLATSLLPGATVPWLARFLGLDSGLPPAPEPRVELVSHREGPGDFVWYLVTAASAAAGASVDELPLPDGCRIVLLLRGDDVVSLAADTVLRADDHACVLVPAGERAFVDLVFGRVQAEDV
jgi:cell volume regulation protein A